MKPTPLTAGAALLLIGVGGFFAGRLTSSQGNGSGSTVPELPPLSPRAASVLQSTERETLRERAAGRLDIDSASRLTRLESIVRGEDPVERNRALLAFIDQLGPGDFEAAIAHFRSLGLGDSRSTEFAMLLSAWGKADPVSALDYAQAHLPGEFATSTVLTSWALNDPDAALRWAESNHTGEGANPYLPGIIRGLAGIDPDRATALMTGMPRSVERGRALDAMMPHILGLGPETARAWVAGIDDEALREGAMLRFSPGMAETDPAGTVDWLVSHPNQATERRMDDVYNVWARGDFQTALDSALKLPPGDQRGNALRGIFDSRPPAEALALLDRYPNDITDQTVQQVVTRAARDTPELAAAQISKVQDPGQQESLYRRMLGGWMRRDAQAAQTWMRSNPLPPAIQNRFLQTQ